jgi:hypothetical protein
VLSCDSRPNAKDPFLEAGQAVNSAQVLLLIAHGPPFFCGGLFCFPSQLAWAQRTPALHTDRTTGERITHRL